MSTTRRRFLRSAFLSGAALAAGWSTRCASTARSRSGPPPDGSTSGATKPSPRRGLKILILGGTGFLGPHVVESALQRGHTLTLFNRGKSHPGLFPNVENLLGNRNGDLKALEGRRWDAVVDTSAYTKKVVELSGKLLAPSVDHYVMVSTVSVYADTSKVGIDENSATMPIDDEYNEDIRANYGALKAVCERTIEKLMPGRVINIRPGLIVGPGDPTGRYTYWPLRLARGGEVLAPGDGTDPVQYIDVRDLGRWIVQTIEERTVGVFNALGPVKPLTMAQLVESCRQAAGTTPKITWVPTEWLGANQVAPWSDLPVWIPAIEDMKGFHQVNVQRAVAKGLTFSDPVDTARATLNWWRNLPADQQTSVQSGLKAARESELLSAWHKKA